jgi:hypothetical protein
VPRWRVANVHRLYAPLVGPGRCACESTMSQSDFQAEALGLLEVLPTVRQSRGALTRGLANDPLQDLAASLFRISRSRLGADSCQLLRNDGRGFFLLFSEPDVDPK